MSELFHQLGIDWRLLLSQTANFAILLFVLRAFAYKPILKILKDRQMKIEEGFAKAEEAGRRLEQANEMAKDKMKEADEKALAMLRETERKAKVFETELMADAKSKEAALLANAETIIAGKAEEARRAMHQEAAALVKAALVRTVELDPEAVDEALIGKAVAEAKR